MTKKRSTRKPPQRTCKASPGAFIRRREEVRRASSVVEQGDRRWGVLRGAEQFLVGLPLPVEDGVLQQVQAALNKQGGWLSSYIDGNWLCIGPPEAAQAARETPGLEWLVSSLQLINQCIL